MRSLIALIVLVATTLTALGNPEPDIPVHSEFNRNGTCVITVEIDPRCFTADPMGERYLMQADLGYRSKESLDALLQKAADATMKWLQFQCEPAVGLAPAFTFAFTGQNNAALTTLKKPDDPIVVTGTWKFKLPAGMKTWRIHAAEEGKYAVVVTYSINDTKQKHTATLFPGETSFAMEASQP